MNPEESVLAASNLLALGVRATTATVRMMEEGLTARQADLAVTLANLQLWKDERIHKERKTR